MVTYGLGVEILWEHKGYSVILFRQTVPNGQCAKAIVNNGAISWVMRDCSEATEKYFACQRRQNLEDIGDWKA